MLVSDLIEIPHDKLADWIALIGAAIAYLFFALAIFYAYRRVRMRLLGGVIAALLLIVALVGYFEIFVAIDRVTFGHAVTSAFAGTPAGGNDALMDRLAGERARSIRGPGGPIDLRRIAFYLLPVLAAAVAAMIVRPRKGALVALLVAFMFVMPANAHPAWGIVVDRSGQIYFSDIENVWRIDTRGRLALARASVGSHVHELSVDDAGNVYGPDYTYSPERNEYSNRIWMMDPSGRARYIAQPSIWRDRIGNTYWVEENNNRKEITQIIRATPDGRRSILAGRHYGHADGKGTNAQFEQIYAMTFGPDSAIYVTDSWTVRKITLSGDVTTLAANLQTPSRDPLSFGALMGLALSRTNDVYVADFRDRCVLRLDRRGAKSIVLTSQPPWAPTGVAIGPAGDVYVMEVEFHPPGTWRPPRVRKIAPDGKVSTVAVVRSGS